MTTPELLTKEEERVWLATYEASLTACAGIKRSMDVAMEAVQAWRKMIGPTGVRFVGTEESLTSIEAWQAKAAQVVAERNSLQEDLAAMKERLAALEKTLEDAEMECLVGGPGGTLPERVRGMRLHMAERLRSLEESSAACQCTADVCRDDRAVTAVE